MKFSQRIGKTPVREVIQKDNMDSVLRNHLWNIYHEWFLSQKAPIHIFSISKSFTIYLNSLWVYFFDNRIDEIPRGRGMFDNIKHHFLEANWYEMYDFIEFTVKNYNSPIPAEAKHIESYITTTNKILEMYLSAYRIVNKKICEITSDVEIASIENATKHEGKFITVKVHLDRALELLSDRQQPDYRNSIKESISAVESLCSIITNDEKATLGKALAKIEKSENIHPALKSAFSSIYGYTSDENGIRHKLLEEDTIKQEDAKFMLVSCSAFVNYLIQKQVNAPVKEVVVEAN